MAGRAARERHLATRNPARRRWALAAAPAALVLTASAASLGLDRDRRADPDPDPVFGPTSHAATVTTDYRSYTRDRRFHPGLKLFYENDVDLMTPREVLRLEPRPRVINDQ
jgi:hypothetical protein